MRGLNRCVTNFCLVFQLFVISFGFYVIFCLKESFWVCSSHFSDCVSFLVHVWHLLICVFLCFSELKIVTKFWGEVLTNKIKSKSKMDLGFWVEEKNGFKRCYVL